MSRVHGRWVLHPTNGYGDADAAGRVIKIKDMRDVFFREIVLSAPPNVAGRECVAMAMLGCSTEVAFCRVGVDNAWTQLDTKLEFSVGSIIHCQDKFLAIDCTGEIFVCKSNVAGATPTATLLPSLAIYKCNLHDRTPEWFRVRDIGDQTLFVSKHFNESFSGTSVSKYKENKIYMSESLYRDPYDLVHRLEIVDIATGASEVNPV
ncbi:uncharacterized protein [Miscanthus floridulus]|uniref:uncharacterized protein n=1 Tax=Miscanthus floridulus TaxID=154761 RepID=UPI00345B48D1